MASANLIIKNAAQVVTCSGKTAKRGQEMNELSVIENGAVIIENGLIAAVGPGDALLAAHDAQGYDVIDASGKAVLPGFVDSHTHFAFGGYRPEEYSWRLKGMPYMEIMQRGGGIVNTMGATRRAGKPELLELGKKRLDAMLSMGVTTVEGKSGYGLDRETELKQLDVMARLNETHGQGIGVAIGLLALLQMPFLLQLLEHPLQVDPRRALDSEGPRDVAFRRQRRVVGDPLEDVGLGGQIPHGSGLTLLQSQTHARAQKVSRMFRCGMPASS